MNRLRFKHILYLLFRSQTAEQYLSAQKGSALIYIIMVMMIFGILGVSTVSMFSSSIMMTSGVPNYTRRALYIAESGMRHAYNELRNSGYTPTVISTLNTTTYSLNNNAGSFEFNVFGKWFEAASDYSSGGSGTITLNIPEGEIPANFSIPQDAYVVNLESYRDSLIFVGTPDSFAALISNPPDTGVTPLSVDLSDSFQVDLDQTVCLTVHPYLNQVNLGAGSSLNVSSEAGDFFPERNGSFYISGTLKNGNVLYYYEEMVSHATYTELANLSEQAVSGLSSGFPFDVVTSDYVILSPINHMIISTSTVGAGSSVGSKNLALDYHQNIITPQPVPPPDPLDLPPDIPTDEIVAGMSTVNESHIDAVDVNVGLEKITLGGGVAGEFGTVFFGGAKEIGGRTDICVDGKCLFNFGVRIFFLLDYQGAGDGFTIALINGTDNDKTSVGGSGALGELLGYGGDGSGAISGTPILYPPKMALEFDTFTNASLNDPLSNNKDALQYVFWGDSVSDLFDDNKHDTGGKDAKWVFTTGHDVYSSPVIGSDGTIYVGSNDNRLYAVNPDGTEKWRFTALGDVRSSPAIGSDGTIYVGSNDDNLYAVNPDGTKKWNFTMGAKGNVESSPAIGSDGTIYVGSNDNKLHAINPDGTEKWNFPTFHDVKSSPAIGSDGTIYVGSYDNRLYAVNPDGTEKWRFIALGDVRSSPAIGSDGTIYVGSDDNRLYAINPDGTEKWRFTALGDVRSSPAIGSDGTIYVGSNDNRLYAINPDGTEKWRFTTAGDVHSSPLMGSDGNIYVGSTDKKIYVIDTEGTMIKSFTTLWYVFSSPAESLYGTVYVGSHDNKLYALASCNPLTLKNKYYTYDNLPAAEQAMISDTNNWLNRVQGGGDILWSVRMEVKRSKVFNVRGNYEYNLRSWIRQCTVADCSDILGTYFEDTRIEYGAKTPHLEQTIELCPADHANFDRFLLGLTEATSGSIQTAVITKLQLGFIRPGDFVITADSDWP